jgi:DNA-binding PadR family transcriptional regulator
MPAPVPITRQALKVLQALLNDPPSECYGSRIAEKFGIPTGSIYLILARLESAGLVTSAWEDVDASRVGRRARKFYQLTAEGTDRAREELGRPRSGGPRPGTQGASRTQAQAR